MAELKEARVPDIGNYDGVPVIELLVAVGDTVKLDQGLVTLESDKATMEVPAPFAGVIREIKVKLGDELAEGSVVALIEPTDAAPAAEAPKAEAAPAKAAEPQRAEPAAPSQQVKASETGARVEPRARALEARAQGLCRRLVDLDRIDDALEFRLPDGQPLGLLQARQSDQANPAADAAEEAARAGQGDEKTH